MSSGRIKGVLGSVVFCAVGCVSPRHAPHDSPVIDVEGVAVWPQKVEIRAVVCLDAGWLEQIACSPGTREHEALVVVEIPPSDVHAALLSAGFEPGSPGRWSYEDAARAEEIDSSALCHALARLPTVDRPSVLLPARRVEEIGANAIADNRPDASEELFGIGMNEDIVTEMELLD